MAAAVIPCSDAVRVAQLQYYAGAEEVSLDQWFPQADPSSALASACYVRSKFGVSGLLPGSDAVTARLVSELEALGCAENLGVPYKSGDLFWTARCSGPATAVGVHWLNPTFVANKFHSDVITGDFVEISLQ
ncbi:hypothetical protein RL72_01586 [Microbacterium azadirachtae]|uniref:Uncharacterized protein n=1 Tax=Microbacterium azadirachtae TaxID=582680 RepID=A0A0F0KVG3_9MICO|nr:hypothetical protein [Microbacterium azadirachtae]KJL24863.1 hypothetical protein RL72_01586 [Microbacterium azadirachtae]